jgi:hypothetical protein
MKNGTLFAVPCYLLLFSSFKIFVFGGKFFSATVAGLSALAFFMYAVYDTQVSERNLI